MNVTLIGAGNLATNLAFGLQKVGHNILQVYSRTEESASQLANRLGIINFTNDFASVNHDSDIYIIAVSDKVVAEVSERLDEVLAKSPNAPHLVVHTAGTMPLDTIQTERRGVFYPMQTFSKRRIVDFEDIPIFVEANYPEDANRLRNFAGTLSLRVFEMSSEERQYLHLAAVFVSNFTNHCCTLAERILAPHSIPFEVMLPLLSETAAKLQSMPPRDAQTGPAVRNDQNVLAHQLQLLRQSGLSRAADIYESMTKSIQDERTTPGAD